MEKACRALTYFCIFCLQGGPRVLTNMSSGDIKAKKGDLVNLLCSAQGEPPITFSWKKDQKSMKSFMEKEEPYRSSSLVVTVEDEKSFGKYTCHIRDYRFQSTTHTISIEKYTGNTALEVGFIFIIFHKKTRKDNLLDSS